MKTSIKKLLSSIQFNILVLFVLVILAALLAAASTAAFERIDNIRAQDSLVRELMATDRDDMEVARIKSDGLLKQLSLAVSQMSIRPDYDIVPRFFPQIMQAQTKVLQTLQTRFESLEKASRRYFSKKAAPVTDRARLQKHVDTYRLTLYELLSLETATLGHFRLAMTGALALILFWVLLAWLSARRASRLILNDAAALGRLDGTRGSKEFTLAEFNSIALRLRQSGSDSLLSAKLDPLTQLPTYEGIKKMYEQRFAKLSSKNIYVCIAEIDNYSKLANHYPTNVINPVIQKIASILKLHQQQNDLIGRIGENRFIIVLMRPDRKKAFQECNLARQMVEETRFKLPHATIPITLSGGFTPKTSSQSLDDAVKAASEYLKAAHEKGGNVIVELRESKKVL